MRCAFVARSRQTICLVAGLLLGLCLVVPGFAHTSSLTPQEVVQLWLKVYPDHLEKAVDLTTLSFRRGVSKKDWVETQEPMLRGLRMTYREVKVMHEEIQGDEARVIVRARLSSFLLGNQVKNELYLLQKGLDGSWLVNRVEEYR